MPTDSSMPDTGSEASDAVNGAMISPEYGVMPSESRPGTCEGEGRGGEHKIEPLGRAGGVIVRLGRHRGGGGQASVAPEPLGGGDEAEDADHARRPLFTSARSAFSLRSGVIFEVKPKGSHRLSGTGCGKRPFSVGK